MYSRGNPYIYGYLSPNHRIFKSIEVDLGGDLCVMRMPSQKGNSRVKSRLKCYSSSGKIPRLIA